jgi:hypothetical protein
MLEPIDDRALDEAIRSRTILSKLRLEMNRMETSEFSLPPYTKTVLARRKFANWVLNSFYLVQLVNTNKLSCMRI